jgi:hypothetical protein
MTSFTVIVVGFQTTATVDREHADRRVGIHDHVRETHVRDAIVGNAEPPRLREALPMVESTDPDG